MEAHKEYGAGFATGISHQEACVEAFQRKIGAPVGTSLLKSEETSFERAATEDLACAAYELKQMSKDLKTRYRVMKDLRLMRAQLMAEELGELMEALGKRDEVQALDALGDLAYVVVGTAVSFNLPYSAAFIEVHRSNMTKEFRNDDHAFGVKGKGDGFSPPNLRGVLEKWRAIKKETL